MNLWRKINNEQYIELVRITRSQTQNVNKIHMTMHAIAFGNNIIDIKQRHFEYY